MTTFDNPIEPSAEVAEAVDFATEPPSHHLSQKHAACVNAVLPGKSRNLSDPPVFHDLSLIPFLTRKEFKAGSLSS